MVGMLKHQGLAHFIENNSSVIAISDIYHQSTLWMQLRKYWDAGTLTRSHTKQLLPNNSTLQGFPQAVQSTF